MRQRLRGSEILRTSVIAALGLIGMLVIAPAAFAAYAPWAAQTSGTTQSLRGVAFVNGTLGCAVGDGGVIRRTTNGGGTWSAVKSGTTRR
jgi:photosystem II stability/assembly factor-like uncharacterized protein